jgi:hypothetical protein
VVGNHPQQGDRKPPQSSKAEPASGALVESDGRLGTLSGVAHIAGYRNRNHGHRSNKNRVTARTRERLTIKTNPHQLKRASLRELNLNDKPATKKAETAVAYSWVTLATGDLGTLFSNKQRVAYDKQHVVVFMQFGSQQICLAR